VSSKVRRRRPAVEAQSVDDAAAEPPVVSSPRGDGEDTWLAREVEVVDRTLQRDGIDVRRLRRVGLKKAALNQALLARHNRRYSLELPFGAIEDQRSSGRCWLFAPMVLAHSLALRNGVLGKGEGFSEVYLYFFSLMEKARVALFRIERAHARREPLRPDTLRRDLLHDVTGLTDGGEWEGAFQLVDRYGLVPSSAMPETASTGHTAELLVELHERIARAATDLGLASARSRNAMLRSRETEIRAGTLSDVVRILVAHLGAPPVRVAVRGGSMTPREYARDVVGFRSTDWRMVICNPRLREGVVYRKRASSLLGGERFDLERLNVGMIRFRELARRSLRAGLAVGFSGDVDRNDMDDRTGIMHPAIFDRRRIYGNDPIRRLSRRDDIFYGIARPDHAMAIVGVDVAKRTDLASPIVKFRVVNSWGESHGDHGIFHMYSPWYQENVFKIAIHDSVLSRRERAAYQRPLEKLPGGDFY
jgi:bleomycin hydrolase